MRSVSIHRAATGFALATGFVGLIARVAPLFDAGGRLLRQFPTEDGYLMLTIARNLGLGHGMSIADGTIPTNGTQPLATILWAGVFALVGGDRERGVAGVLALEIAISLVAVALLHRVALRLFGDAPRGRALAGAAAALWFASAGTVRHAMNCLETGAYAAAVLGVALALLHPPRADATRPRLRAWAGLGALLGLAFWVRVDAVLLAVSLGLAHLAGAIPAWRTPLRARIAELTAAASVCALVASPWLLNNLVRFGSIVPVSGHSEGFDVRFGAELSEIPAALLEYAAVVAQIPVAWETRPALIAAALVALAAFAWALGREVPRASTEARTLLLPIGGFALALCAFYGFWFGAGYFMSRYLFALSPFLALCSVHLAGRLAERLAPRPVLPALAALALAAVVVTNARVYALGDSHQHFPVVAWAQAHVPDDVWMAAPQSGTLGFFHDRTLNLDGKVNPEAMAARREGKVPEYLAASPARYVADWYGLTEWLRLYPALDRDFELVVADREANLAVLARRSAPPSDPNRPAGGTP